VPNSRENYFEAGTLVMTRLKYIEPFSLQNETLVFVFVISVLTEYDNFVYAKVVYKDKLYVACLPYDSYLVNL
jgi:hypothetical protein